MHDDLHDTTPAGRQPPGPDVAAELRRQADRLDARVNRIVPPTDASGAAPSMSRRQAKVVVRGLRDAGFHPRLADAGIYLPISEQDAGQRMIAQLRKDQP